MEVTPPTTQKHAAHHLAKLAPLIATLIIAGLFFPTTASLYERWIKWDESLSHGLVVIGIFLVFIFKSSPWQAIKNTAFEHISTLVLLGITSCLWFLFHIVNLYIFEQLILLPLLFLLVAAIFGWRVGAKHYVLIAMPIFTIPVWDQLTDALVNLSGFAVGNLVRIINMPANIDGNSIFIPNGHIVIADGCSGLRYLLIALSLGYIISYLNHYNLRKMGIVLIVATLLALFANWLRIFILVIVGYTSDMQSPLMKDHEIFGWILFALISFPAIYFSPVVRSNPAQDISPYRTIKQTTYSLILPIVVVAIGPLLNLSFDVKPQVVQLKDLLGHHLQPITAKKMPLNIQSPKAQHKENVRTADDTYIQIDQYQRITQSDKLVPYITRLYNNEVWSVVNNSALTTNGVSNSQLYIFRHKTSSQKIAQLQWFDVAGWKTSSLAIAKLLQVPALLLGKNHFMIITIQAECTTDSCDQTITKLKSYESLTLTTQGN